MLLRYTVGGKAGQQPFRKLSSENPGCQSDKTRPQGSQDAKAVALEALNLPLGEADMTNSGLTESEPSEHPSCIVFLESYLSSGVERLVSDSNAVARSLYPDSCGGLLTYNGNSQDLEVIDSRAIAAVDYSATDGVHTCSGFTFNHVVGRASGTTSYDAQHHVD
ncbi:MAG: hypothetical protein ACQEXJ_12865 [Myxococcota bacterium]